MSTRQAKTANQFEFNEPMYKYVIETVNDPWSAHHLSATHPGLPFNCSIIELFRVIYRVTELLVNFIQIDR